MFKIGISCINFNPPEADKPSEGGQGFYFPPLGAYG